MDGGRGEGERGRVTDQCTECDYSYDEDGCGPEVDEIIDELSNDCEQVSRQRKTTRQ